MGRRSLLIALVVLLVAASPAVALLGTQEGTGGPAQEAREALYPTEEALDDALETIHDDPEVDDDPASEDDDEGSDEVPEDPLTTAAAMALATVSKVHDDALNLVEDTQQDVPQADVDTLATLGIPLGTDGPEERPAPAPSSEAPMTEVPPAALVAAGVATATGAGALFFWLTGSSASTAGSSIAAGKGSHLGAKGAKKIAPVFSPLFTRFEGRKVLEHPNRAALYTAISEHPGIRLQDLCEATGLSRTAVTHHLRLLEGQHLVVSRRIGRGRHYYENGGRFEREQKQAYAILQNDRTRAIAEYVRSNPGAIQKQLCESLGLRPSVAHWHVKRLVDAEIIRGIRQGRTVSYYPDDTMARISL